MLQEKGKVATVHCHMLYAIILYVTMFYVAIWPILLLVIHFIMDEVSEIDHYGEILIGPYSSLIRASYFILCSVHAQFSSVLPIDCKWCWGCRYFELLVFQCFV